VIRTAWVLAQKDLRLFLRDRTGLALALLLPLFLATIFGAAMGGMSGDDDGVGKIALYVEDLDDSERSRDLLAALGASKGLEIRKAQDVRRRVADGKAAAALLVPNGYGADLGAGRVPALRLYRDPSKEIEQQIVAGNLMSAFFRAGGPEAIRIASRQALTVFGFPEQALPEAQAILEQTWSSLRMAAVAAAFRGAQDEAPSTIGLSSSVDLELGSSIPGLLSITVEDVAGGRDRSRKAAGQSHAVSGIAVMMLLFGLAACGATLLEEQSEGTLRRLQLSPAAGPAILAGKFLFTAIVGAIQLVILFTYGGLLFSVPILRAPVALVALSLALIVAATGLGILLAVFCRSRKQLEGLSTLVILVMSALGGSWFPLVVTPGWYQKLGHFTVNAWAMDGYQKLFWYGKGLSDIAVEIAVLLAIGGVGALLALRGFRRRFGDG
jgi:ABC-2 type transport system permease protein